METRNTILGVIFDKAARHIAANKAGKLVRQGVELSIGLFLGALVIVPDQTVGLIQAGFEAGNYAAPKFFLMTIAFFNRKSIVRILRKVYFFVKAKRAEKLEDKFLDKIPVAELTDYLIRNRHFRREGVNGVRATFGLNMERYNALAKRLEANEVLVRGVNNGRILADHWSRQSLFDYLSGYYESADMIPRFKITRINGGGKVRLEANAIPNF